MLAATAEAALAHLSPYLGISPAELIRWDEHSFEGSTPYALTEVDGREAVHALCEDATASGLFYRHEIALEETPVVEWSWRVDEALSGVDETTKEGDDYPARLHLVDERSVLSWRTRALNYVRASERPKGSAWPNAHAPRAHMVAVRSGTSQDLGAWHSERRNVRRDFERYHGRDVKKITAVAIMTDCDDTGERLEAWYGTIRFLPEGIPSMDMATGGG